jgi:hypothetical protein
MRTLVLYYSNTGNTQKVAEVLARELGGELGEITCGRYLRWYGPLAMAWDIFTRGRPPIDAVIPPDARYDLIVVGGPVWAAHAAPPVMSFLASHKPGAERFGLFVTCRGTSPGSPPEPAIADMKSVAPGPVDGTAIFRAREITSDVFIDRAIGFVRSLVARPGEQAGSAAVSQRPGPDATALA